MTKNIMKAGVEITEVYIKISAPLLDGTFLVVSAGYWLAAKTVYTLCESPEIYQVKIGLQFFDM